MKSEESTTAEKEEEYISADFIPIPIPVLHILFHELVNVTEVVKI